MNRMGSLTGALLDLLNELKETGIQLIIGGGFGIYLRYQEHLRVPRQTLLKEWPEPRSTNDLDLFLRTELILDSDRLKLLAEALKRLDYKVIETAKSYQFIKNSPIGSFKIDILTGPKQVFKDKGLKVDDRRVHPKPSVDLHAHPVDEAITLEEQLLLVIIEEKKFDGTFLKGEVFLPHPFTFLMMKLFALRDNIENSEKDYGRHHALDLYTTIAMMSLQEWESSIDLFRNNRNQQKIVEARRLVYKLFDNENSKGILRLKENKYYRPEFEIPGFLKALKDLFAEITP
ncbi:MAG: hypothetical protein WAW23_00685 [Candidatus Methanoperedens sp.]